MLGLNRLLLASALLVLGVAACSHEEATLTCPPPGDVCYDSNGNPVDHDGAPIGGDDVTPTTDTDVGDSGGDGDSGPGTDSDVGQSSLCNCPITPEDTDGDCIPNALEITTDPNNPDTDGDCIRDGCEDKNHNGHVDAGESDPTKTDTDGDCIPDGLEDKNCNGIFELSNDESSPVLTDSDRDGILDGTEDKNCDGHLNPWVDVNGDGCFDAGDTGGETDPANADTDGDFVGDGREDASLDGVCQDAENSCAFIADTDCDKLPDGSEDTNRNGVFNTGETNPRLGDSDGDGIPDGLEDSNLNGVYEPATETNPRSIDSDGDGIRDGTEDANHNGLVDAAVLVNGCWNGSPPSETDPRKVDSDGDGITDDAEDKNKNGVCDSGSIANPNAPGGTRVGFVESCAFLVDTDCDGISDGNEDHNHDGSFESSETDAKFNDTDRDGLQDGCPPPFDMTRCEDLNNNGVVDPGETDPRSVDTDFDALTDRCEVQFDPSGCTSMKCTTNPLNEDTDGDGKTDGEEDANHNCKYEPLLGETDPRVANTPPAQGTIDYPKSQVCDAENLKELTFAAAPDPSLDYQLAFEVEKSAGGSDADYSETAFGIELANANNVIVEDDPDDMVWGHLFQSPVGVIVDEVTAKVVNRDVYGFIYATADATPLDTTLDGLRDKLNVLYSGAVVEISNVPSRPAHDDHPAQGSSAAYRVFRAQRQYRVTVGKTSSDALSAISVRQNILTHAFLPADEINQVRPTSVLTNTNQDPVYGEIDCPSTTLPCYQNFTMYIGAVQRPQEPTPTGGSGVTLYVVVITPNDSTANVNDTVTRLYNERLTRLEDLTGGSAVARYLARRSSACEDRNATKARADLLFVVDDSRSMQAIVDKLQQAAHDAQAVLTANSNNVDFRTAMTTTNPTQFGRTFCASGGPSPANGTFLNTIGCLGSCDDVATCTTVRNNESGAVQPDGRFMYQLPGGGGTFYYEDTAWLDCKTSTSSTAIDPCDSAQYVSQFTNFYNGQPRVRLTANAGFLGSDPAATCPTYSVNLNFDVSAGGNCDGDPNTPDCCERLAAACTDGPRVLTSQMCDLIRAMGGRPDPSVGAQGARPSSQNESGVRSARRLITSMGMAYPLDTPSGGGFNPTQHLRLNCTTTGDGTPCDNDNDCGPYDKCDLSAPVNGRGNCIATGNCQACDPRGGTTVVRNFAIADETENAFIAGASGISTCSLDSDCGRGERCYIPVGSSSGQCIVDCKPVPLVTIFLSDEEDYAFKDECASRTVPSASHGWQISAEQVTDESQLQTDCFYRTPMQLDANGYPLGQPCFDQNATDPFAYCSAYVSGATKYADLATGYLPDTVPGTGGSDIGVAVVDLMKWRDYNAPECASVNERAAGDASDFATAVTGTCIDNPCRLFPDQASCTAGANNGACVWSASAGICVNYCEQYTAAMAATNLTQRDAQHDACNADPRCFFDTGFGKDGFDNNGSVSLVITNQLFACQPKVPLNDCQACKRLFRRYGSVIGTDGLVAGDDLVGLGDVGPVYSIVRERGRPGFRDEEATTTPPQDECAGGPPTWGRGDGQAFRDIATDTLGRAQNVCATDYQDFMQELVTDIVALSAPYKLAQPPIAATIKVGIGRLEVDGVTWDYIEVPRSNVQGFVYDDTSNSLGFKSDPIDGVCAAGDTCSANGIIETSEVDAARNIANVPRANDLVFISYRFWRPVPCPDGCPVGDTCVRSLCPPASPTTCSGDGDCLSGQVCAGSTCIYDCTDDGYLERCVPNPCQACETYDPTTGTCSRAGGGDPTTEQCQCFNANGVINCDPTGPNTCPPAFSCDETCFCEPLAACAGAFNADGSVKDCDAALACCALLSSCANNTTQGACTSNPNCTWNPGNNTCSGAGGTCCDAGEVAVCFAPPEDPSRKVFACQGGECSCTTTQTCTSDADCQGNYDPFGNGPGKCVGPDGSKHCDCNPITQECLTDSTGSCACKQSPG